VLFIISSVALAGVLSASFEQAERRARKLAVRTQIVPWQITLRSTPVTFTDASGFTGWAERLIVPEPKHR